MIAGTSGEIANPDKISELKATADENGISVTVGALGEGLKNNIEKFSFSLIKVMTPGMNMKVPVILFSMSLTER